MRIRLSVLPLIALAICASCRDAEQPLSPTPPSSAPISTSTAPLKTPPIAPASASSKPADSVAALMTDRALGALISSISEQTGEFPSDNFVSNETSYLDVVPVLGRASLQGRAYVGVGPEQNLTYALVMQPAVAYIVDIRRQNMLELMAIRAAMESSETRAQFLCAWTSRPGATSTLPNSSTASIEALSAAIASAKPEPAATTALRTKTLALLDRLGVRREPGDDDGVDKVLQAFARKGLELAYSMKGSARKYPTAAELLAMRDDAGVQRSFLATEAGYQVIRRMMGDNRIVPVVGDLAGDRALRGVAENMKKRGTTLGAFYVSNVEQYLFEGGTYGRFLGNVKAFPSDDRSVLVRVWFDQGRAHPLQRKGHRTTSLVVGLSGFLARGETKPYRTFWEAATDETLMVRR